MPPVIAQRGFSLMELIVVIVLLGILGGSAGLLVTTPMQAYNDQLRRQQLVDQGEMALRQIARDIHRALPNSLRVGGGGTVLEMVNTTDGARYRDEPGGVFTGEDDWLDFTAPDTSFNLLGRFSTATLAAGERLVIYNTGPSDIYQDVTADNNPGIVTPSTTALALSLVGNEQRIGMSPAFRFSQRSPGQRIFVIDGPISYACNAAAGTLTRYDAYPYQLTQPGSDAVLSALSGVQSGPVVSSLSACRFDYNPGSAQRGGMVSMEISLANSAGESITLLHQVHVVNVP